MTIPDGNACFVMMRHCKKHFVGGCFFMSRILKTLFRGGILFVIGGLGYVLLENIWRGYSHITMFFAGGLSFLCIELMDMRLGKSVGTFGKCVLGSAAITSIELAFGCVFNLYYKMDIWDYSHLPFQFLGQISLLFSLLWGVLTYPVLKLGRGIRRILFREEKKRLPAPSYHTQA